MSVTGLTAALLVVPPQDRAADHTESGSYSSTSLGTSRDLARASLLPESLTSPSAAPSATPTPVTPIPTPTAPATPTATPTPRPPHAHRDVHRDAQRRGQRHAGAQRGGRCGPRAREGQAGLHQPRGDAGHLVCDRQRQRPPRAGHRV
ncbi:hypothetical protein [Tessaracoccus coleopterorum]|uniref:hypothetical protein n=1 Tax=Tessaracoccus coleopterorum TaxID=2714950 RepID=UPI001E3A90CA|nr:hypothetical protein [Tessaracoccus coleopterorum]